MGPKCHTSVSLRGASSSLRKPRAALTKPIITLSALLILCGHLVTVNAMSERFRPVALWGAERSRYAPKDSIESAPFQAENSFSFGRQRSASVKCPPPRSPGERAESTQPTERSPKRNLPMRKLLQSFSLRLGSGRPKYETLVIEKPSLSILTWVQRQQRLAEIDRSSKEIEGIQSPRDIIKLSAEKRKSKMAVLQGLCIKRNWSSQKDADVFPDEIVLIYLLSKVEPKEHNKTAEPAVLDMALVCISGIYNESLDKFNDDLKSAAETAFNLIYQDHPKFPRQSITDYHTIDDHARTLSLSPPKKSDDNLESASETASNLINQDHPKFPRQSIMSHEAIDDLTQTVSLTP
ncbi:hypothetical protein Pst134EA_030199 [Puccinia striiformis f. sp. tritici]|uniref:hypothetical protein n=1 Tax=Puccinia striiformis f. sp. tritici TaxID=168172 RepID=UPI0020082F95|nr:hypothetical protein Pst134EA_030199 [Puccinia striiformis f. sp. tritici]KAH9446278.1 hypothetical protein Pst134EA_030199 [Puccinia striiformis f. sp. tritici]